MVAACADEEDRAHVARDAYPGDSEARGEDRRDPVPARGTQALERSKVARTLRPRKSPSSMPTSGLEPGISLQRGGGGTLPNGSSTAVSAAQAAAGSGWSPPVGSHWSVQVPNRRWSRTARPSPSGRSWQAVVGTAAAAARQPARASAATACQRLRAGVPGTRNEPLKLRSLGATSHAVAGRSRRRTDSCQHGDQGEESHRKEGSAPIHSPRAPGQANPHHRRRRLHRHDARAPPRRRERGRRGRQPPSRRALGHAARRASELHLPPGGRARLGRHARARARRRPTSSTAPRSPASTPCSRARCGRCA